mgnify:CR=1 FL=1
MRTLAIYHGATIGISADDFRAFESSFAGSIWRDGFAPETPAEFAAMLDNPWRGAVDWCDFDAAGGLIAPFTFPLNDAAAAALVALAYQHGVECQDFARAREGVEA